MEESRKCLRPKPLYKYEKCLFDGLVSSLDMTEERISELEDISMETSHSEKQKEKKD